MRENTAREETRANMFLAAVLETAGASSPVKIRNMSRSGALIETPVMPEAGSEVRLIRGRLSVPGRVIWRDTKRFGVRFSTAIAVPDWMATSSNGDQCRVDQITTMIRSGVASRTALEYPSSPHHRQRSSEQARHQIEKVCRALESLGERLADDAQVLMNHGSQLQSLDGALQALRALKMSF